MVPELAHRVEADASPAPAAAMMMSRMMLRYEIEQFYSTEAALSRHIFLEQTVLLSRNLSSFF